MNNAQLRNLFEEQQRTQAASDLEWELKMQTSEPRCPVCGGLGFAVTWVHMDCHNILALRNRSPEQKMRARWEQIRHKTRPIVIAIHGDKCADCGAFADTIDHLIPISKGGTNDIENLRPMCGGCNSSKKDKIYVKG